MPAVVELLQAHLATMHELSPPEDVHALDVSGLSDPAVTLFGFWRDGQLLALGALREYDADAAVREGEIKSMHTATAARGTGIGRALVEHLLGVAARRGLRVVSLETGSTAAFAPARSLYASMGFTPCGPFGDYVASPHSVFFARPVGARP